VANLYFYTYHNTGREKTPTNKCGRKKIVQKEDGKKNTHDTWLWVHRVTHVEVVGKVGHMVSTWTILFVLLNFTGFFISASTILVYLWDFINMIVIRYVA